MFHLSFEVGTRQCKPHVYSLHLQRNTRVVFHTGSVSDTSDRRFDDWIVIDENGVSGFHALVRAIGKVEPDNPHPPFATERFKLFTLFVKISVCGASADLFRLFDAVKIFVQTQCDTVPTELLERHIVILLERQSLIVKTFIPAQEHLKRTSDVANRRKGRVLPVALAVVIF